MKLPILFMSAMALSPVATAQTVGISDGKLSGTTKDGVASWKGIPFAAPPTGNLRWRAPQPPKRWRGVRQAHDYGADCMQVPFPSDAAPLGTMPSENCLTLNVWRPAAAAAKRPVLVWIYGGGFVNGGASPPTYSGAELAKRGLVFVSFNYRVGRFGTFAHPQLTREDADKGLLGNYGYMDQLAALRWVAKNIAAFGGDPANVTIMGESAGGMSVNTLLTSPMSAGLFARAVVMSGGDGGRAESGTLASVEKIGVDFAERHGIAAGDPNALAKLRALSADAVTDGLNMTALFAPTPGARTFAAPFADGSIAVNARAAFDAGAFPKVPVMIGATSADIGGRTGVMVAGARDVAGAVSGHGSPTYYYRFSYVADSAGRQGAAHATDIPFFLGTERIKYGDSTSARDVGMSRTISSYVVNFVKTGNPNGDALPVWPRYLRAENGMMDFTIDGTAEAKRDPWAAG